MQDAAGPVRMPERRKRSGVSYAVSDDGIELPVIDVTHPAFRVKLDAREVESLTEQAVAEQRDRGAPRSFLRRAVTNALLSRSLLAQGIRESAGGVLSGMATYLLKLGPDNLGHYAGSIDRRIAASLPCLSARLRVQDMAHLTADAIAPLLEEHPSRPLTIVNIAGGTGADSLNALIVTARRRRSLLAARHVDLLLLDPDAVGPAFGRSALRALLGHGAPLEDLSVELRHVAYDWTDAGRIGAILTAACDASAVVAVMSEGGLFEYASDEVVAANLGAIRAHAPGSVVVTGSVTRTEGAAAWFNRATPAALAGRGLSAFTALVQQCGFRVAGVIDRPLSHNVCLART